MALPPDLTCPITRQLFVDPVMAADGFSYERDAIEKWFRLRADDDGAAAACSGR